MKKIALIAFLLAVCVAAGRAQESRQDISISGTGLVEPFIASSTDVQVSANRAFGALVSYRFMLTPSSAVEANYGITYQNKIHYVISNTNHYIVLTRTQEASGAYVRTFNFHKFNPFLEAGAAGLIFLPIRNSGTTTLDAKQQTSIAACTEPASHTRSVPASTFAQSSADWSPRCRPSAIRSSRPTSGTTSTTPPSAWHITSRLMA